jgi:hypothetical protein
MTTPINQAKTMARTPTFILAAKLMTTATARPHSDKTARLTGSPYFVRESIFDRKASPVAAVAG